MNARQPIVAAADVAAAMPEALDARLDRAAIALSALEREQHRLERLGLELPLARCHEQLRFWRFVHALHAVAAEPRRIGTLA